MKIFLKAFENLTGSKLVVPILLIFAALNIACFKNEALSLKYGQILVDTVTQVYFWLSVLLLVNTCLGVLNMVLYLKNKNKATLFSAIIVVYSILFYMNLSILNTFAQTLLNVEGANITLAVNCLVLSLGYMILRGIKSFARIGKSELSLEFSDDTCTDIALKYLDAKGAIPDLDMCDSIARKHGGLFENE